MKSSDVQRMLNRMEVTYSYVEFPSTALAVAVRKGRQLVNRLSDQGDYAYAYDLAERIALSLAYEHWDDVRITVEDERALRFPTPEEAAARAAHDQNMEMFRRQRRLSRTPKYMYEEVDE